MSKFNKNQLIKKLNSAISKVQKGEADAAREIYEEIGDLSVETDIEVRSLFANLSTLLGLQNQAIEIFTKLSEEYPENSIYQDHIAYAYSTLGNQTDKTIEHYKKSIALNDKSASTFANLGAAYSSKGEKEKALEYYLNAYELKKSLTHLESNIAAVYFQMEKYQEAADFAEKALKRQSGNTKDLITYGQSLAILGNIEKATIQLLAAIKKEPNEGLAYYHYSKIKKFTEADKAFLLKTEKVLSEALPSSSRAYICFCMGKAYDDLGDYDKAFEFYNIGNKLLSKNVNLKPLKTLSKSMKKVFKKSTFSQSSIKRNDSKQPIFIIGMPRSGSTLVEQIISSHSKVSAAGENPAFARKVVDPICLPSEMNNFPKQFAQANKVELIQKVTSEYLEALPEYSGECTPYITDKMLGNFSFIGLIHYMFPNAKIIHTVRNPIDTCLSSYFQLFDEIPWSFDIEQLTSVYSEYRDIMDYWKATLPENTLFDIHYEDLTSNQEEATKRLIDFIGLNWEDDCLAFYNAKNKVDTASLWQVRQPMYKSSTQRWLNYGPHLQNLADNLQPFLSKEDITALADAGINPKKPKFKLFG